MLKILLLADKFVQFQTKWRRQLATKQTNERGEKESVEREAFEATDSTRNPVD
jgi:hypothetical protein